MKRSWIGGIVLAAVAAAGCERGETKGDAAAGRAVPAAEEQAAGELPEGVTVDTQKIVVDSTGKVRPYLPEEDS